MKVLVSFTEKITQFTGVLAAWFVLPLVFVTVYEVFARYVLGSPTIWAYELGTMMTGAYFILGCAYALKEKAHIRIDVFYSKFLPKLQAVVTTAGYLFLFLPLAFWFSYALFEYGLEALHSGERTGQSAWNPVVWPFRFIIFAGFALLTLQAVAELIKSFCILCCKDKEA